MNGRLGLIRYNGPKYNGWWNSNSNVDCYSENMGGCYSAGGYYSDTAATAVLSLATVPSVATVCIHYYNYL